MKKILLVSIISLATISTSAMADSCIDKKDPEKAFRREVRIAVSDQGKILKITKTGESSTGDHDPEYNVTFKSGVIQVTCDDSGDDQCECQVATGKQ